MVFKRLGAKYFARHLVKQYEGWLSRPAGVQREIFNHLIKSGMQTRFGKDHAFDRINSYEDFKEKVPLRDYEGIRPYIERIIDGEHNVLWKGRPVYFAKTSGTTSGAKYIPISKDSISNHINGARDTLLHYIHKSGNARFVKGKMIFLSGSPELQQTGGILTGRLSGIVNHHIPSYLQRNQVPSYATNCIENWEKKVDKIVEETLHQDLTLISGIPPWIQTYFDQLMKKTGKPVRDIFPGFRVLVHGGMNFSPYRAMLERSIGKQVDTLETYPASEGFIAFQDDYTQPGLMLNLNSGIFFEFVPAGEIFDENPSRLTIEDVEFNKNYVVIINSNAGLWGYNIGDTVKFISKDPCKIVVTGRVEHYISAFGEHVIAEEVEDAMAQAAKEENVRVNEFTVAPVVNPSNGLPHHEWFIEFGEEPNDLQHFREKLDDKMCRKNIYYQDLIKGKILERLKIRQIRSGGFNAYMASIGKLGGQNKLPRLSNDRSITRELEKFTAEEN